MGKRILTVIMIMVMAVSLIACSSNNNGESASDEPTSKTQAENITGDNNQVSTGAPTEKETETPTETSTEVSTEALTENSTESSIETNTQVSTEGSTEGTVQEPTEGATEATTEAPTQVNIELNVAEVKGYMECIKLKFENEENASYSVGYKKSGTTTYSYVSSSNIEKSADASNCEIPALAAGSYDLCIKKTTNEGSATKTYSNISVTAIDRSGYAHFNNTSGIGAYNDDGTIKSNTIVLNLTNTNKNTITATFAGTKYVGIANILMNLSKSQSPVLIRVHGRVSTNQWNYKAVVPRRTDNSNLTDTHFTNTFSAEYGENIANLNLRLKDAKEGISYNYKTTATGIVRVADSSSSKKTTTYNGKAVYDDDSNYNCITINNAKNVTIEGVGTDAEIFQWGMSFNDSSSIEVKNLTFTGYPEDALAFMSSTTNVDANGRYWVHHNTFNVGKNNWDLTGEQDKSKGDGALDINNVSNVTASYNVFNKCGKTGLVGNSDSNSSKNVTFHHNYYNGVSSRLPLARGANIHIYNNYYYNCGSCLSIRTNGYVFSESNYFDSCKNAHKPSGAAIKSFNDYFKSTSGVDSTKVSSRTQYVSNACKPDKVTDYSKFDVDAKLFYYDSVNKKTDVTVMTDVMNVPAYVKKYAGVNGRYQ